MKKIIVALSMIIISSVMIAQSDYSQFTREIQNYTDNYSDDQVIGLYENHYGVPRNSLIQIFGGFGYNWGNVTLGLEMSNFLSVPVPDLLGIYRQYPEGKGWGAVAKRYGIMPGYPQFHRMKAMMSEKNRHWSDIYNVYRINPNPSVGRRNRVIISENLIRIGTLSPKEMKKINKEIEKRNKKIYKQQKKMVKKWEKKNKEIRKERDKRIKEQNKRMKNGYLVMAKQTQ